jgi:hypothetical protein
MLHQEVDCIADMCIVSIAKIRYFGVLVSKHDLHMLVL